MFRGRARLGKFARYTNNFDLGSEGSLALLALICYLVHCSFWEYCSGELPFQSAPPPNLFCEQKGPVVLLPSLSLLWIWKFPVSSSSGSLHL